MKSPASSVTIQNDTPSFPSGAIYRLGDTSYSGATATTSSTTNHDSSQSGLRDVNFHPYPLTPSRIPVVPDLLPYANSHTSNSRIGHYEQQNRTRPSYLQCQQDPSQNSNFKLRPALLRQPCEFQSQGEYLLWLQQAQRIQEQLAPIKRPWWLWFIAIFDILSAVIWTIRIVYTVFTESITFWDVNSFVWTYFFGSVATLLIFVMGVGLFAGIRSKDDTSTLWYCKLWAVIQLLYLFASAIHGFIVVILHAEGSEPLYTVILWFLQFLYRLGSYFLVKSFIAKLKRSERLLDEQTGRPSFERNDDVELQQQDNFDNQNNANKPPDTGGFCGAEVALLLSL